MFCFTMYWPTDDSASLRLYSDPVAEACTLPASLQGSGWKYTYGANEVTVSFGTNTMSGLSYTARGEVLNSYHCISNTANVYVFKSVNSYTNRGEDGWLYLCMKITRVSDDLFYFSLLADIDTVIGDRVYNPPTDSIPQDTDPKCDVCSYATTPPDNDIRILQRIGTGETLPGSESPCLPCGTVCNTDETSTSGEITSTSTESTTTAKTTTSSPGQNQMTKLPEPSNCCFGSNIKKNNDNKRKTKYVS